jgi:hypothetical protein
MTELLTLSPSKENYYGRQKRQMWKIKDARKLSCDEKLSYLDNVKKLYSRTKNK